MAQEPHYPKDAPVGSDAQAPGESSGSSGEQAAAKPGEPKRSKHLMAGAAIGIGSAAIVAALLYANRKGKSEKTGNG
jgi:hypothetical protein